MKLRVREDGKDILVYNFRSAQEATEIFHIIRDYFPRAQFVFEQPMH